MNKKKKKFLTRQNQTIILIIVSLIAIYFTAIINALDAFNSTVLPNQIGSVVLAVVLVSKDFYRMTNKKFFLIFTQNLLFYGIIAFLLIFPHTAKTHLVMEEIEAGNVIDGMLYLITPVIAFFIIFTLVVTSIKMLKPRNWLKIHAIIWAVVPFFIAHMITIYYNSFYLHSIYPETHVVKYDALYFAFLYILVYLVPFIGLLTKSREKYYKTYIRQIITLVGSTLIILIFFQFGNIIVLSWKILTAFLPLFILIYLSKRKNYNLKLREYFLSIVYALLFILIPLSYNFYFLT